MAPAAGMILCNNIGYTNSRVLQCISCTVPCEGSKGQTVIATSHLAWTATTKRLHFAMGNISPCRISHLNIKRQLQSEMRWKYWQYPWIWVWYHFKEMPVKREARKGLERNNKATSNEIICARVANLGQAASGQWGKMWKSPRLGSN